MQPSEQEPICLISYEIAAILVNGYPDTRPGFWKAYQRELELNRKTNYNNYHVQLCRQHLASLHLDQSVPVYFRKGRLTTEKKVRPLQSPQAFIERGNRDAKSALPNTAKDADHQG